MRKLVVLFAVTLSIVAVVLAALPESRYALIIALIGLILGGLGQRMSKDHLKSNKTAQLAMLLGVLAIILTSYKFVFMKSEGQNETIKTKDITKENIEEEELDDYELELLEFREDSIQSFHENQ